MQLYGELNQENTTPEVEEPKGRHGHPFLAVASTYIKWSNHRTLDSDCAWTRPGHHVANKSNNAGSAAHSFPPHANPSRVTSKIYAATWWNGLGNATWIDQWVLRGLVSSATVLTCCWLPVLYDSSRNASLHFRHGRETTAHSCTSSQPMHCIHSEPISSHSAEWIWGIHCIISNSVLNFLGVHSRLLKHSETIGGDGVWSDPVSARLYLHCNEQVSEPI